MNNIKWKEGAVCYADGKPWFLSRLDNCLIGGDLVAHYDYVISFKDFQLNEIREGDFIQASELDTEQKYNEVVEVFGLFGFERFDSASYADTIRVKTDSSCLKVNPDGEFIYNWSKGDRQLTYHQIIAIGKLKRMMLERENQLIEHQTLGNRVTANKYEREITDRQGNSATVDVYDVLKAFEVTCPATQHAVKKLLCSGLRGHKNLQTDLIEAKESIARAIELN